MAEDVDQELRTELWGCSYSDHRWDFDAAIREAGHEPGDAIATVRAALARIPDIEAQVPKLETWARLALAKIYGPHSEAAMLADVEQRRIILGAARQMIDAIEALGPRFDAGPTSGAALLEMLSNVVREQDVILLGYPDRVMHRDEPKRGRPANPVAQRAAIRLCDVFISLTGGMPTVRYDAAREIAYGPFVDMIDDVFAGLGINGSPHYYARWAIDEYNRIMEEIADNMRD